MTTPPTQDARMGVLEAMARAMIMAQPAHRSRDWSCNPIYDAEWIDGSRLARAALQALLDNVTIDMGLAGAVEVNKQMRGPGAPADYHAAVDAFRAMLTTALNTTPAEGK